MATSIRSPYPDVEIPDVPLTPFVYADAASRGDRTAIVCGSTGRSYSYAMLDHLVGRCAAGLVERGLQQHEVVGIFAPNVPEYPIAFHGVAQAGATNTTVNSLSNAHELAFQLRNAHARFLITIPQFLDRALPAAAEAGIEEVYVFGEAEGATPFASLLADGAPVPQPEIDCANDLVSLPYSSGTTGLPKGVMLTHQNLVANMTQFADCRDVGPDDRVIGFLPFFHIYGQTVVLNDCLRRGAEIVTHAALRAGAVPAADPGAPDHGRVRGAARRRRAGQASAGRQLRPLVAARRSCRAPRRSTAPSRTPAPSASAREVFQGYGLTETSPVTHAWRNGEPCTPGAVGMLLASTEARIVDPETATDCDRGELWIRGPQVMAGYLENAEATAATIDADGWLRTGDIVTWTRRGIFQIVDRLKELIKYNGYQVPPAELEGVLLTNPAIADAAVIGVPDEACGEIPKAFVVLKADVVMTPAEVIDFVAAHVSPYKRIRACEFIDEIPKSASGKILRRVLIERERAAQV